MDFRQQKRIKGMVKLILLYGMTFFLALATAPAPADPPDPQQIVDAAIEAHGGEGFQWAQIEFDFRAKHYTAIRRGGLFSYERRFSAPEGEIRDMLSNDGFTRNINGKAVELSEEWKSRYGNSVNSVIYFALLPYGLNDPAVQKRYLGEVTIKGEPYHKIEITFRPEDGGKDYEDEFIYWFHQEKHTLDYLAYRFHTDGGGTRFREAYRRHQAGGLLLTDYYNYVGPKNDTPLSDFDRLYQQGDLEIISDIDLNNLQVHPLTAGTR